MITSAVKARNIPRTARLMAALTAVLTGLGALIGGTAAMVVVALIAVVFTVAMYWFSGSMALTMSRAVAVTPEQAPQLHGMVEYQADLTGAELMGDPEPLASALVNLQRGADVVPMPTNPSGPPMYIVDPLSSLQGRGIWKLFFTHPPMEERVRRLRALAPMSAPAYAEVCA